MTTLIKPGLMVSLATELRGGVSYQRVDLEKGDAVAKWETTKHVDNPEEFARASQVRSKARALIASACSNTAFGLICPLDRESDLDTAVSEARRLVDEFNASATTTHVRIFTLRGRIASTDDEAARGLASEVQGLILGMQAGIDAMDPEAIRRAADQAKAMTALLGEEQVGIVSDAIAAARKAARQIVARVEKKGEDAAMVAMDIQRGALEKARMLFLDLDAPAATSEEMPAIDINRAANLDLDGETPFLKAGGE